MIVDDPVVDAVYTSSNFKTSVTSYGATFSVISGKNTVADKLVELIQNSNTSIHLASGHLRSHPVAEALLAKHAENPDMDIRIYLDNQEYISQSTHEDQQDELQTCLDTAGTDTNKQLECYESGMYFSYAMQDAGIDLRFKYYCYRWDYTYAPQMHHKYFVFDGKIIASGSYNLSDNAEHNTIENMVIYDGSVFPEIVEAFESNFESMWATDDNRDLYQSLLNLIENTDDPIPLTFDPMALTWEEVTNLKRQIRTYCPAVDSEEYRKEPTKHTVCYR